MPDKTTPCSLTGGCRCGQLRYTVTQVPLFVMACHCTDCQQQSASAFSLGMPVEKTGFSLSGDTHVIPKTADSGKESRAYRCPTCAVWTHTTTDGAPDQVVVRPSTLDDATWVEPVAQIFLRSALPWAKLDVAHEYATEFDDPSEIVASFRTSGIPDRITGAHRDRRP